MCQGCAAAAAQEQWTQMQTLREAEEMMYILQNVNQPYRKTLDAGNEINKDDN